MRNTRIFLVMTTAVLICIGIVMIYSSSSIFSWKNLSESTYFLKRHVIYIIVGLLSSLAVMAIDYRVLQKYSRVILGVALLLLLLVLIPGIGREIGGARRWFRFFGFSFQPSEIVKIAL